MLSQVQSRMWSNCGEIEPRIEIVVEIHLIEMTTVTQRRRICVVIWDGIFAEEGIAPWGIKTVV
jgi:hypothetical protein